MTDKLHREGEIHIHDSKVEVWEENFNPFVHAAMTKVMHRSIEHLRAHGWSIQADAAVAARWPTLKDDHWEGRRGALEVKIVLNGRSLEILFFQNLAHENRHGGHHDFQRMKRMADVRPALRILCLVEMTRLVNLFASIGYRLTERQGFRAVGVEPSLKMVRDLAEARRANAMTPIERFNWHWGSDRFERDETGWPSAKEMASWSSHVDANGNKLTQGAVRYTRDYGGRLVRGEVFEGINGMWVIYSNGVQVRGGLGANQFFACAHPELEPRRVKDQRGRLKRELEKAVKAEDFKRVATLGTVLARCA